MKWKKKEFGFCRLFNKQVSKNPYKISGKLKTKNYSRPKEDTKKENPKTLIQVSAATMKKSKDMDTKNMAEIQLNPISIKLKMNFGSPN